MTDYGQPITFGLSLYPSVELLEVFVGEVVPAVRQRVSERRSQR